VLLVGKNSSEEDVLRVHVLELNDRCVTCSSRPVHFIVQVWKKYDTIFGLTPLYLTGEWSLRSVIIVGLNIPILSEHDGLTKMRRDDAGTP